MEIIIKQSYAHINRSFSGWDTPKGRKVHNKAHYESLCREQNLIPYEQAQENAQRNVGGKPYVLSEKAHDIINQAKLKSSNGKIKFKESDKLLEVMIDEGIVKKKGFGLEHLPACYQSKGGFTNV